jgi:SAM-dependent methyltransferase
VSAHRLVGEESLAERLDRLEQERLAADRAYNTALTALDQALGELTEAPPPPPDYDDTKLPEINEHWNILVAGAPPVGRFLGGRLSGLVWRIVGPIFDRQQHFNAALVDHLNRNVARHREAREILDDTLTLLRADVDRLRRLHGHLIQFAQTITLYVDSKDRAMASGDNVLNDGLGAVSDDFLKRWESLAVREARATARVQGLAAGVDDARAMSAIAQQTALSLKRDVERLLAESQAGRPPVPTTPGAPAVPPDLNAFKYLAFENAFRGAPELVRSRLEAYVPLYTGRSNVLDIGCGRGEFLDLLRAAGVSARGVDLNEAMVEESRARGFDATCVDALTYLRGLPDASLGGVFAAQVVEHLAPDYLAALLEVAAQKMKPGGRIALETINPSCWVAFFESYLRDLTHVRPIHPETLQYLVRVSGFADVELRFSSPVPPADRLQPIEIAPDARPDVVDMVQSINGNLERLNGRMFSYQDYAAVAIRA